jgi:hypothetical protein
VKGRRTRSIRLGLAVALVAVLAGIVAATAGGLAFIQGDPCQDTKPLFVCPEGVVDANYSIQFKASGGCGPALPYQYRVTNGALPPGLSLSSSGLISGKPTTAGGWRFWVELSDEDPPSQSWCVPKTADREFEIGILPRIRVGPESAAPGTVGVAYSLPMTATMVYSTTQTGPPSSPVTWSISAGTLPPGLALGTDGVISGTPTTVGSYTFTVLGVLDPRRQDTKALTIEVRAPVTITAPPVPRSEVRVPFELPLTAAGGTEQYTWSLSSGALPQGVALGTDGVISGTPSVAGTFRFTATATDTESRAASYTGAVIVAPRLTIATRLLKWGKVGRLYRQKMVATGGVIPKTWKITRGPLPKGVRFDRRLGILSGTPAKPGRYRLTFEIVDALEVKSTKTLRLFVVA